MGTIYIRNMDNRVHLLLKKEADERNISMAELCRNVLTNYAVSAETSRIGDKYRSFVEDMLQIYHADIDNFKQIQDYSERMLQENRKLHDELAELVRKLGENIG